MAGLIVADASALIAFLDESDAHHEEAIERIIEVTELLVHPLTLGEVLVHPVRTGTVDDVVIRLEAIGMTQSEASLDARSLAELRTSCGLKMPDCVVLATAIHHGVGVLTFDRRLAQAADDTTA